MCRIPRPVEAGCPGTNAIIAETVEADNSILDNAVAQRGGAVVRWPLDEVLDALDAQQDAAEEASRAAHKAPKEQRHEEHKASREERLDKLKAKFHTSDDK